MSSIHSSGCEPKSALLAGRGKPFDLSPRMLLLAMLLAVSCFYANLAKDSYMDDFRAFYLASVTSQTHLDPYVNHVDLGEQYANSLWDRKDSLFIYPPSALYFLLPLAHFSYNASRIAFGSLMALAMVAILCGLHRRFPRQTFVLFALFLTLPMVKNIDNGNIDVLILGLVLAAFYLPDGPAAGMCLGAAVAIKLAPVLLLGWFVARRRYRMAIWTVATSGALAISATNVWGAQYWREFLDHLAHHESPGLPVLHHVFTTIYKVKDRVLVTSDGVYAFQHDIAGYLQNPLHVLGHSAAPAGLVLTATGMYWLFFSRRGKALSAERSFFLLLPITLFANNLLWPMGLVACFPLIVLLVEESATPNLTAAVLIVPLVLTKQVIGNWNFGVWLVAAGWCVWRSGWLAQESRVEVGAVQMDLALETGRHD